MLLSQLEYLVAVKEFGSMNKAAAELFCSQPTITNAFKSIENEFGCKIIIRTSAGITFTGIGERIVEDARVILGITNRWKEYNQERNSQLKISFSGFNDRSTILKLLTAYRGENAHDNCALVFNQKRGLRVLQAEDGSMYRLGFIQHTPQELTETVKLANEYGMKIAKLNAGCFAVYGNIRNPLMKKENLRLADLTGQKVVLKQAKDFSYIEKLNSVNCDCSTELGDHDNIMIALMNDASLVSLSPTTMQTEDEDIYLRSGAIAMRKIIDCNLELNQYFIFPAFSRLTESEKAFVEYIKKTAVMFEIEE